MDELIEKQPLNHTIDEAIGSTLEEDKDVIFEEVDEDEITE